MERKPRRVAKKPVRQEKHVDRHADRHTEKEPREYTEKPKLGPKKIRRCALWVSERDSTGTYEVPVYDAARYKRPEYMELFKVYEKLCNSNRNECEFGPKHERSKLVKHEGKFKYTDPNGELQKFEGVFFTLEKYDGTRHAVNVMEFFDYTVMVPDDEPESPEPPESGGVVSSPDSITTSGISNVLTNP